MFLKKKSVAHVAPAVPDARVQSIAQAQPPREYGSAGGRAKRAPRAPVSKQGSLRLASGEEVPVLIRNLSVTGCRVEFSGAAKPTGRVLLTESSAPTESLADVVWTGEGACGLIFVGQEQPV